MQKNATELLPIARNYENVGLPGCCGSMDVVRVRWSQCPAGDLNRAKGKVTFPSLAFECVTDFSRRIMGVYGPQFGSRNDKEIVKSDPAVLKVTAGWLSKTFWRYYSVCGRIRISVGMYFICGNGNLRWPTSIFPSYTHVDVASTEGYFSSNLESVRKDVECTFGILKKRWRILHYGLHYRNIKKCEKIFVTCCCLHNFLVDIMEWKVKRVNRGEPIDQHEGLWLEGHTPSNPEFSGRTLEFQFNFRRNILAQHLHIFRQRGTVDYSNNY